VPSERGGEDVASQHGLQIETDMGVVVSGTGELDMRAALGIAVSALCLASQPALAGPGATLLGSASLQALRISNTTVRHSSALTQTLRVRFDIASRYQSPGLLNDPAHMRQRLRSSMLEFYPSGDGFHVGAGIRMFERQNFFGDAQRITHGMLYNPRGLGDEAPRAGFRGYTPAITAGYSRNLARGFTIGVEGGAMLTRANAAMPRSYRLATTGGIGDRGGFNPVANMVATVSF
jgi:hypothetical protein